MDPPQPHKEWLQKPTANISLSSDTPPKAKDLNPTLQEDKKKKKKDIHSSSKTFPSHR
jgi:hypothetical protein